MTRLIVIAWIGFFVCSCSGDIKEEHTQKDDAVIRDSLSRPEDVGEHKSIHQEEWEYHKHDTTIAN